jgi:beta-N-acetylhexosaminidase
MIPDAAGPSPIWVTVDADASLADVSSFLHEASPYGVILFSRHLKEAAQVRELNACIHEAVSGWVPRIAVDQEGGRVNRLSALGMSFPSASEMAGDAARVEAVAFEMGTRLRALGFDVDFAPVADLGPAHPGTGLEGRVYSDDPSIVTSCCEAFLRGLARADVAGCLKHFPGLGGSRVDSHQSLPAMEGTREERHPHWVPYASLSNLAPYVMIAHAAYEGLWATGKPSSLEPAAYALLREVGFPGLSVTDDLSMGAVGHLSDLASLAAQSLAAGASLALWVSTQQHSLRALERLSVTEPFLARRNDLSYG